MTDETLMEDETLTTETVNADEAGVVDEGGEPNPQEQPQATVEVAKDPKDDEIARLQAEAKRDKDRIAQLKGHKQQLARVVKNSLDEGLIDEAEAANRLGVKPEQLRGIINAPDIADNPIEAQNQAFDALYLGAGVKATLDELMGEDTQKYVAAFAKHGFNDPDLVNEYQSIEQAKLPAFVVKTGKALLEELGDAPVTLRGQAKRIKELEALLASKGETPEVKPETVIAPKKLPLSGLPGGGGNGAPKPVNEMEKLFG